MCISAERMSKDPIQAVHHVSEVFSFDFDLDAVDKFVASRNKEYEKLAVPQKA